MFSPSSLPSSSLPSPLPPPSLPLSLFPPFPPPSSLLSLQVVYVSGSIKVMKGTHFLVTVVRPVSPPSILEIRMEANMFVSHYSMELKCIFYDGR
jgi:hypothetical protein